MKIHCARRKQDFIELTTIPGGLLDITITQDSSGDRRSDESTVVVTPLDAMRLSEALRRYALGKSLEDK